MIRGYFQQRSALAATTGSPSGSKSNPSRQTSKVTTSLIHLQASCRYKSVSREAKPFDEISTPFTIFEDPIEKKTAQPRHRAYYGNSVPSLCDATNNPFVRAYTGEQAMLRQLKAHFAWARAEKKNIAMIREIWGTCASLFPDLAKEQTVNILCNLYDELTRRNIMTLHEAVTGFLEFSILNKSTDVWLWVVANNYHRTWSETQCVEFKKLLFKSSSDVRAAAADQYFRDIVRPDNTAQILSTGLRRLKINNLKFVDGDRAWEWRLYPVGEDQPLHRRQDFSPSQRRQIDATMPSYWAPGEEYTGCVDRDWESLDPHADWLIAGVGSDDAQVSDGERRPTKYASTSPVCPTVSRDLDYMRDDIIRACIRE